MNFLVIIHITIAIILILLVLVQDSKGGAMGSTFGGGGSNTLFGATGVENILTKSTKIVVIFFAITCILLTRISSQNRGSVLDTEGHRPTQAVPENTKQTEGKTPIQEDKSSEKTSKDNTKDKTKSNNTDNIKSDSKKADDTPKTPPIEETK